MTQKTKLEILGPYTPEHEGPFCTRDGREVRLLTKTKGSKLFPVVGFIEDNSYPSLWFMDGRLNLNVDHDKWDTDLMCAREVPVAREAELSVHDDMHLAKAVAVLNRTPGLAPYVVKEVISAWLGSKGMDGVYVREVLPGEGA